MGAATGTRGTYTRPRDHLQTRENVASDIAPSKLVSKGNRKLGPRVWHTNLTPGDSCPGASAYCADVCYAKRGFYVMQRDKYKTNLDYLRDHPALYALQLCAEVAKLPLGSTFRFHTGGDIDSVQHVEIIRTVCESREDISFYLYTRSWNVDGLREAIESQLFPLHNLTVWASTDPTMPAAPDGWREATILPDAATAAAARMPVCPEQTGKRASCSDCGLCWNAKPTARLAFIEH